MDGLVDTGLGKIMIDTDVSRMFWNRRHGGSQHEGRAG